MFGILFSTVTLSLSIGCLVTLTKIQFYAHLFAQTEFCFYEAEAHNCFKMLFCFLAISRGLTMNIL